MSFTEKLAVILWDLGMQDDPWCWSSTASALFGASMAVSVLPGYEDSGDELYWLSLIARERNIMAELEHRPRWAA